MQAIRSWVTATRTSTHWYELSNEHTWCWLAEIIRISESHLEGETIIIGLSNSPTIGKLMNDCFDCNLSTSNQIFRYQMNSAIYLNLFYQNRLIWWTESGLNMEGRQQNTATEQRNIPPFLRKLLALDVEWTKRFVSFSLNFVPIRSLKTHCKFLEVSWIVHSKSIETPTKWPTKLIIDVFRFILQYSCHGLVWFSTLLAICWMIDNPKYYQTQMNLLFGLILDIVFVASIKAATRRRRPTIDDNFLSIGPDKFSFPSGHASRAFYILLFFTALEPLPYLFWPPLFAWAVSVSLSRLLLYRHHILDVLAGITLGILEAFLISILWLGKDVSAWVMSWLSDERLPGTSTQEDLF